MSVLKAVEIKETMYRGLQTLAAFERTSEVELLETMIEEIIAGRMETLSREWMNLLEKG